MDVWRQMLSFHSNSKFKFWMESLVMNISLYCKTSPTNLVISMINPLTVDVNMI